MGLKMLRHKVNIQKLIVFWHIDNEQFWKLETVLFNTTKNVKYLTIFMQNTYIINYKILVIEIKWRDKACPLIRKLNIV